jgi:predicted DCC family thiol-disulfide oxidoreductase YuxK
LPTEPRSLVAPILYDPDCGFCRVSMAALLCWDRRGRLRPVPLGGAEADDLLAGMPEEERMASWHLVGQDGAVRSGGDALPDVFDLVPGGRPLARLSERFPGASKRGYRWVAEHRSLLGRPLPGRLRRWADGVIARRA